MRRVHATVAVEKKSFTDFECVFVDLFIYHETRMLHFVNCVLLSFKYFSTLSDNPHNFCLKKFSS
jgi:hypothetical protein